MREALPQGLVVEPHPGQHPGTKVLHQHVGVFEQAVQDLAPLGLAQIEGDRTLVTVELGKVGAEAVDHIALAAHHVALPRGLDLDHLGAVIPQHLAGEGAGDHPGQIDHAYAGQAARGKAGGVLGRWPRVVAVIPAGASIHRFAYPSVCLW